MLHKGSMIYDKQGQLLKGAISKPPEFQAPPRQKLVGGLEAFLGYLMGFG